MFDYKTYLKYIRIIRQWLIAKNMYQYYNLIKIDIKKDFGKRVRYYRKQLGYSQIDLADKADITTQTLSGIETGYTFPSYPVFMKLVNALNVPIVKLFLFNDDLLTIDDKELQYLIYEKFKDLDFEKRKIILTIIDALKSD